MKTLIRIGFVSTLLLIGIQTLVAQTRYQCIPSKSTVTVNGTSTLHDWEMTSKEFSSSFVAEKKGADAIIIKEGTAVFKAAKIVSGTSGMDKKAYEALKTNTYPDISFKFLSADNIALNGTKAMLKGELTLCGIKKTVELPVTVKPTPDAKLVLATTLKLKMSDYKIEPPVALMGTIKTGDEIELDFMMTYESK
jgi:polyisoprenoid-binding protein YceI